MGKRRSGIAADELREAVGKVVQQSSEIQTSRVGSVCSSRAAQAQHFAQVHTQQFPVPSSPAPLPHASQPVPHPNHTQQVLALQGDPAALATKVDFCHASAGHAEKHH